MSDKSKIVRRIRKALILCLAGIAAAVAIGTAAGLSMWAVIVAYWFVLTCANLVFWMQLRFTEEDAEDMDDLRTQLENLTEERDRWKSIAENTINELRETTKLNAKLWRALNKTEGADEDDL